MSQVRKNIGPPDIILEVKAVTLNKEEFGVWSYFVLKNNILEMSFQFDVAFSRIAKEEY